MLTGQKFEGYTLVMSFESQTQSELLDELRDLAVHGKAANKADRKDLVEKYFDDIAEWAEEFQYAKAELDFN